MLKRFLLSLGLSLGIFQVSFAQEQVQLTASETGKPAYLNITEINIGRGFKYQNTSWSVAIQTINGFQFNEYIWAGIGIGLEKYINTNVAKSDLASTPVFSPVFTDVRVYLSKGKVQPFLGQDLGYMFCLYQPNYDSETGYNNNVGGILINPFIGIKTSFKSGKALNFSLGYRLQQETIKKVPLPYYIFDSGVDYQPGYLIVSKNTWSGNYITFKTGLTF